MAKRGFGFFFAARVGGASFMDTFGYVRQPAESSRNQRTDVAAQEQAIRVYGQEKGWPLGEITADDAGAADLPLFSRPGGAELSARLRPGDRLIVVDARWVFADLADWQDVLRNLVGRGVALHLVAQSLAVDANLSQLVESAFQFYWTLKRACRGHCVRESMAAKKRQGKRYCRHAGYGYRWEGDRRVVDEYESGVMCRIAEWRKAGHSYYGIAAHLLRYGVRTKDGREWSPSRVRRAYRAMSAV